MAHIEKRLAQRRRTWRARYRTPAGAQRSKSFARKVDAERFLAGGGERPRPPALRRPDCCAKVRVGEWAQRWLEDRPTSSRPRSTRYEGIVRKHIDPTWDRVTLANVSHGDVQAWVTELSKTPVTGDRPQDPPGAVADPRHGGEGRATGSQRRRGVNLPRPGKPEHRYLTHDQVEDLAAATGYPSDPSKHASPRHARQRDLPARGAVPGLHRGSLRRDGRAARRRARPSSATSGHRRVGHPGPGQGPGVGHAEDPPTAGGADPDASSPPNSPLIVEGQSPRRSGVRGHPQRQPLRVSTFRRRSRPRRPPSASPTCIPTSSDTPQPASRSPPEPTSRSSSRCSATPQRP